MKKHLLTLLALLTFSVGSMAQTFKIDGKTLDYGKVADTIRVVVNDSKKTVLKFVNYTSMPTAPQVLAEYKRVTSLPPVIVVPPSQIWEEIGTGSGQLIITSTSNKNLKIKKGTYEYIKVEKLTNVVVDGSQVLLNGTIDFTGVSSNIEFFGFKLTSQTKQSRAIRFYAYVDKFKLHDVYFQDWGDYTIANEIADKIVYDKTSATSFNDWVFDRLTFENCNKPFSAAGGIDPTLKYGVKGLYVNFKFTNSTFNNCDWNIVWMGAGENFEFSNNKINNQNIAGLPDKSSIPNGEHNRFLDIQGYGNIFNNIAKNVQGNFFGIRNYSFSGPGKTSLIYNNVFYNSLKYGFAEIQPWGYLDDFVKQNPSMIQYTGVKIYNNTVGKANTSKDWEGQILDLYNMNAPLEFYNNLGFDLYRPQKEITDMINYLGNSNPEVTPRNNRYFKNWQEAVDDIINFKSKFPGYGADLK